MRKTLFIAAGCLLILASCAKYKIPVNCPEGTAGLSYQSDIQPIFDANCVMCHSGSQSPELSSGSSYAELVDGGYIADPDLACESVLYQVFEGTHSGRASEEEVLMILGWIQDGAPDN